MADRQRDVTSERRQRAVFDSAVDVAIIATDRAGLVTDWNTGAARVFGWTSDEMRGQAADRFFTPEDRADDRATFEMRTALEQGRVDDERWHLKKDGTRIWASGEMMPLRDEDGTHLGFMKIVRDRTAEHLAGLALEQTQERYRLAAKATNDAIWDWDLTTNHVLWNEALEDAYGHPLATAEPTGDWWIAHIHHEDRDRIDASIHAVIDGTGTAWTDEYRFLRADGSYAEVLDRGHVIRDAEGRAVRMIGAMLDVTRLRAAETALGESEERYRALFEAIDDGFCIIEFFDGPHGPLSDYVHVEANPGYERHTGIPDIVGRTLRDLAPAEAEGWLDLYGGVLRTGEPIRFERAFPTVGRHIEVSAARIEPASRRQVSVLFRDISARRRAEDALRASEAAARANAERVQLALAAGAIIGTWFWDPVTDRFTVDDAFVSNFGLDPALRREGITLAHIIAAVHPDDQAGLAAATAEAAARGGAYAHQYRTRRADGHFYWLEANGRVDHAPDGTPLSFSGVLIDIEERRAVEAERARVTEELRSLNETLEQRVAERTADLMRAEEALRQSQKMEAVGQLTGGLAHDFNNLLAGISGSLELMQTRMQQGRFNDVERYMAAAQGAAKRAAALTHRLLAFSRRQTLDPKPTDVNRLVDGMQEMIQRTVGPGISVEAIGAGGLWPALVDPSQLENALLNLCINARDAMPDGGRITIETANRWFDERAARKQEIPEGQYLSLCVTDTGTGMPPEVIARVFEPFFTTKPIGEGTGLGLSMIYGFAQQSGGQVRIYSEVGKGTTVCIYLPRHYGEIEDDGPAADARELPRSEQGETVLVVDDEPTVRMLITDILEDLGYVAIEAGDSAAGLKVLQSDVRIDLLVTDVGLPGGMNGRQMADAGRVDRSDLKVLFITGYAENAILGNGQLAPGMAVLTKPFSIETMAARIRSMIEAAR